jgi:hypothetical protein
MESGDDAVMAGSWGTTLYIGAGEAPSPAPAPRTCTCMALSTPLPPSGQGPPARPDQAAERGAWPSAPHPPPSPAGSDPYELINQGVAAAAQLSGTSKALADKELPPSLDLFGWCTWDAFYSTVSARGLQEGLQSFTDGGVQPRLLIIDDGWQVGLLLLQAGLLQRRARRAASRPNGAGHPAPPLVCGGIRAAWPRR